MQKKQWKTWEGITNEKNYLKCNSKPSYTSNKIFDNNLVVIQKKQSCIKAYQTCIHWNVYLELIKVLMYQFPYDNIKNKYDNKSKLLFTDTDSLMYEIKTEDVYEDFSSNKEMFNFSNFSTKLKYYDDSNRLIIGKMKDETRGSEFEEFVELKAKMYSFLVDDNNEHKKEKGVNRNLIATKNHNEYKDVLLNSKFLRHSMNRIQSKDYGIGTYEINKICFVNKRYGGLALGC